VMVVAWSMTTYFFVKTYLERGVSTHVEWTHPSSGQTKIA
jgi:hypothetical protein